MNRPDNPKYARNYKEKYVPCFSRYTYGTYTSKQKIFVGKFLVLSLLSLEKYFVWIKIFSFSVTDF